MPNASVFVLTGAGVSADSGVRTFRDPGGLWEGYRPEEVATPQAWARDRALVWRFYQMRRAQLPQVQPNAAHRALAAFAQQLGAAGLGFTLVTQNVDDLHERAGSDVVHMHGEIGRLRCERCGARLFDLQNVDPQRFTPCRACGHDAMRPDVVWFGEVPVQLDEIETALRRCTHFLAIGTSGAVYPAAGFLAAARRLGAATWVQSLEAPDNLATLDRFHQGRAAEVVPGMLEALARELGLC